MDNGENKNNAPETSDSDIAVFDDFDYTDDDSSDPNYLYHTQQNQVSTEHVRVGKSILDFAREAEMEGKEPDPNDEYYNQQPPEPKNVNEDMDLYADMLSDMDYGLRYNNRAASELRRQMDYDDITMEMGRRPSVSEMSDTYTLKKQKSDFSEKNTLNRDEKLIMKERLENEINKRPENFNARQSAQMYYALVDEQEVKQARRGFGNLMVIMLMGILLAGLTFFKLNWNDSRLFFYFSVGTAGASLILIIKLKFFKMISCLYYAVNTAFLIGPGAVKYMTDPAPKPDGYKETLIYFIVAVAISAIICISLATNMDIENYYSTPLGKKARERKRRTK